MHRFQVGRDSRSLDYSEPLSVKDDLDVRQVRVQALTPAQIEEFLKAHAPNQAAAAWSEISGNPRLLDLYSTPYFLKLLADQLEYDPRVAGERAALFTGFVRRALEREIAGHNPHVARVLDERDRTRINQRSWGSPHDLPTRGPLIPRLQALAHAMQERSGGDGQQVMLARDDALARLEHPHAEDLLKAGEQLTLLDEDLNTDQVRFFHQLLQEYFAARELAVHPAPELARSEWRAAHIQPPLADSLAALQDYEPLPPPEPTGWEETTILAAGMVADPDGFVLGVAETNLALAGRCATTTRVSEATKTRLQTALIARSRDPQADLRARIAAGRVLGELGDPRFELRHGPHGDYLAPLLITIAPGTYPIGSDEGLYDDEAPAHTVTIDPCSLGQFPVTNAEWRLFMAAGGYQEERWWEGEAARRWRREGGAEGSKQSFREFRAQMRTHPGQIDEWLAAGKVTSTQARDYRHWYLEMTDGEFEALLDRNFPAGAQTQPRWWDDPAYNPAAHPVVGISWYEARAYCAWLSAQTGQTYRLPNESEWEAAARGPAGRAYPWEGDFDANRCNTFESHVRGTTPVGVFPGGDTPEGIADLAGNVREWTGSLYQPYGETVEEDGEGRREARGGSWDGVRGFARGAYRYRAHPGGRGGSLGFRLVCVAPIR